MADIARLAGVSTSAVSLALNGRPGVSDATRKRIEAIAENAGWYPSAAARSLINARAFAIGLVLTRPPREFSIHPFQLSFIAGLEAELSASGYSLLFNVAKDRADEEARYRRWWTEQRVDGVALLDIQSDDSRLPLLEALDMPHVVAGPPPSGERAVAVWNDDATAVRHAVERLFELGHRRIARVAEKPQMMHTEVRSRAFRDLGSELGLRDPQIITIGTSEEAGTATRNLLRSLDRPTAILYDSDVAGVAGLRAAKEAGLAVPDDLSIVAYDDSVLCEATTPSLTAVAHDVYAYGAHVGRALLAVIDGAVESRAELDAVPHLVERASSGVAPVSP